MPEVQHPIIQTGQTTCHDSTGREISCAGSFQDAELKIGIPWPSPRFTSGGETVLDKLTGLTWARNANLADFPLDWLDALDFIQRMNGGAAFGFNDWRLPNRRELRSLISHQTLKPALPAGHPFRNVIPSWYWTSTSAAVNPAYAWYIHMEGGRTFYGSKDRYYLLWPVRGTQNGSLPATGQDKCYGSDGSLTTCRASGQDGDCQSGAEWPKPRFETVAGDTVIDNLTGINWRQTADLAGGPVGWAEALASVKILSRESGKRWRLPNINELDSLVDLSRHSPALQKNHPFIELEDVYWSSTTSMFETDWAWALYLNKGAIGVGRKAYARFHVWAARDADG